jgi:hypothetical protein
LARHCSEHAVDDAGFCGWGMRSSGPIERAWRRISLWWLSARPAQDEPSGHRDDRVRAVVAAVPVAAVIEPASLQDLRVDAGLVEATQDRLLVPALHVRAVQSACRRCRLLAALPEGGHDAVLSPWNEDVARSAHLWTPNTAGFDRSRLPALYRTIAAFFAVRV